MKVLHYLLIPYYILELFILKPLARFILRKELEFDKKHSDMIYEAKRNLHNVCERQKDEIKEFNRRFDRIKYIIKQNKDKTCELSLTERDEIIMIAFDKNDIFDYIKVYGENGDHPHYDCQISLQTFGHNLKIHDFTSRRAGYGYGKTLLEFTINEAKRNNIQKVYGDLSYEDRAGFDRLIPFYKSFGFECELFENTNRMKVGGISMDLQNLSKRKTEKISAI